MEVEPTDPIAMNVYTSPTCGCCGLWVEHAEQRGFKLSTHYPADLSLFKFEQGIKPELQSCHTAVSAEGYLFEGHVPARYMLEFLANPPAGARGLAVPAMPVGSPGMEVGDRFTPYEVLLLSEDGGTEVFARVTEPGQQYVVD
ncbi:MAG TPA: metal-binding protein [Gammaproteobacteria bacterium]|nr:metal-binding protein [Gammaproteobacteria bacterium]